MIKVRQRRMEKGNRLRSVALSIIPYGIHNRSFLLKKEHAEEKEKS